jgi:hypothetical protein
MTRFGGTTMPMRTKEDRMPLLADLPLFMVGQQASSPEKRRLDRQRVLAWYVAYQRGTAHEAARGLGMLPTTVLPRVTQLFEKGCLVKTDAPRRPTGLGGTARELAITALGMQEYRGGQAA